MPSRLYAHSCNVQNIDNQVKAVNGAHMKEYKNKWQTTA